MKRRCQLPLRYQNCLHLHFFASYFTLSSPHLHGHGNRQKQAFESLGNQGLVDNLTLVWTCAYELFCLDLLNLECHYIWRIRNITNIALYMFNRSFASHIHLSLCPTFTTADRCGLKINQIILIWKGFSVTCLFEKVNL